jgi:hypothetical protein
MLLLLTDTYSKYVERRTPFPEAIHMHINTRAMADGIWSIIPRMGNPQNPYENALIIPMPETKR